MKLYQLIDVFFEDLGFTAAGEWSKDDSNHDIKNFEVDGGQYRLKCIPQEIEGEQLVYVDFSAVDETGRTTFARRNTGTNPKTVHRVFSTVANSTLEKYPDATTFVFSADDEGRVSLYTRLAERVARKFRGTMRKHAKDGTTFFWAQKPSSKLDADKYIDKLDQ